MSNTTKNRKSIWVYESTHAKLFQIQKSMSITLGVKPNTDIIVNHLIGTWWKAKLEKTLETSKVLEGMYQLEEKL